MELFISTTFSQETCDAFLKFVQSLHQINKSSPACFHRCFENKFGFISHVSLAVTRHFLQTTATSVHPKNQPFPNFQRSNKRISHGPRLWFQIVLYFSHGSLDCASVWERRRFLATTNFLLSCFDLLRANMTIKSLQMNILLQILCEMPGLR